MLINSFVAATVTYYFSKFILLTTHCFAKTFGKILHKRCFEMALES